MVRDSMPSAGSQSNAKPAHVAEAESGQRAIAYRADVDGLRAVAVIAVVAFHAGFSWMPGGFTGVDVFFVISGYLIGAQIFRQSTAGTFRYLAFYARRLRRIVPALIFLIWALFLAAYFLLTPSELRELGKESVAAVFGASNLLFYVGGDYFAPAADLNPLLHTWSLGVEEQFYIVLPVVALVVIKVVKMPVTKSLIAITALTFAASIALTFADASAAFYLLPTRFWELTLGAVLSTSGMDVSTKTQGIVAKGLGVAGAGLIAIGFAAYRPAIEFPGAFALLPTIGAAAIIVSSTSWLNCVVLANPIAVFVGKVSYSWYLWHWPIFYFNRILELRVNPGLLAVFSLILGIISWSLIEKPFRRRRDSDRKTVLSYAAVVLCTGLVGMFTYQQDGIPSRLPSSARISAENARHTQDDPCLLRRGDNATAPGGCRFAAAAESNTLAVVGDSHGASISPGFAHAAFGRGLAFRQLTKSLCTGLWGFANVVSDMPDLTAECLDYQQHAFKQIADDPRIRTVVLASRWSLELELVTKPGSIAVDLEKGLDATISRLEKLERKVVLVQDAPAFLFDPYARTIGESLPIRKTLRNAFGITTANSPAPFSQLERDRSREILRKISSTHPNVALFDPWKQLCNSEGCQYEQDQNLYYFDNQHLTSLGALKAVGYGPEF